MIILENPNPTPVTVHVCEKCQCKFGYTEQDIKKESGGDANGRIGGTHYYWTQESVNCPNCGEAYIIKKESGYSSSQLTTPLCDEDIARDFNEAVMQIYED